MIGALLARLRMRQNLTAEEAGALFAALLDQKIDMAQVGAVLMGLAQKGETVTELTAAVAAMRARMIKATVRADAVDVCGTGGDGAHTVNISTAVALVVAACGIPVAKHGNRAASSSSGASDVLTALGVTIDAPQAVVERCVNELGIGYFAAPLYHPALAALVPVRRSLGIRTIFNLLGPLCNPAGVTRQMIGVADAARLHDLASVLCALGSERIIMVHGDGGLDELSLSGPNQLLFAGRDAHTGQSGAGDVASISPEAFGLARQPLSSLRGGAPTENAAALRALLAGAPGAYRDVVLMNAALALHLGEDEDGDIIARMAQAADAIDSGRAAQLLDRWIIMSRQT